MMLTSELRNSVSHEAQEPCELRLNGYLGNDSSSNEHIHRYMHFGHHGPSLFREPNSWFAGYLLDYWNFGCSIS
jgi:hypothetical protein